MPTDISSAENSGCFSSPQLYLGHRAEQIKKGRDLILNPWVIILLWDSAIKEYQCTYATVISFLASNFWLWFPSWMTINETWAPLLVHIYLPWGSVWTAWTGSIQTLTKPDWCTPSVLQVGELHPPWCHCTKIQLRNCSRKAKMSCTCEFLLVTPQTINHVLEVPC